MAHSSHIPLLFRWSLKSSAGQSVPHGVSISVVIIIARIGNLWRDSTTFYRLNYLNKLQHLNRWRISKHLQPFGWRALFEHAVCGCFRNTWTTTEGPEFSTSLWGRTTSSRQYVQICLSCLFFRPVGYENPRALRNSSTLLLLKSRLKSRVFMFAFCQSNFCSLQPPCGKCRHWCFLSGLVVSWLLLETERERGGREYVCETEGRAERLS